MEDGTDEVKVFSASTIKKNEPDDDIDVDGIEDRLSPVVEEPTSPNKNDALNGGISSLYTSPFLYPYFHPMFQQYLMAAAAQANVAATSTVNNFHVWASFSKSTLSFSRISHP